MKTQDISVKSHDSMPQTATEPKPATPPVELLTLIPRDLIQEFGAFVFEKNEDTTKIASLDPKNPALKNFALKHFGPKTEFYKTEKNNLELVLKQYPRNFKEEILELTRPELGTNGNIIKIIDDIIPYAIAEKASDVHIGPLRTETAVRFRVDGILHRVLTLN